MLMLHYIQEVSYFNNLQVLGEWNVAPTNKCSSEMKAALLPSSYVEKVGQCTWGKKNLLLFCSHPSNSVLIVSMNTFQVAVLSALLQLLPTTCHGSSPNLWFVKVLWELILRSSRGLYCAPPKSTTEKHWFRKLGVVLCPVHSCSLY